MIFTISGYICNKKNQSKGRRGADTFMDILSNINYFIYLRKFNKNSLYKTMPFMRAILYIIFKHAAYAFFLFDMTMHNAVLIYVQIYYKNLILC